MIVVNSPALNFNGRNSALSSDRQGKLLAVSHKHLPSCINVGSYMWRNLAHTNWTKSEKPGINASGFDVQIKRINFPKGEILVALQERAFTPQEHRLKILLRILAFIFGLVVLAYLLPTLVGRNMDSNSRSNERRRSQWQDLHISSCSPGWKRLRHCAQPMERRRWPPRSLHDHRQELNKKHC